MNLFWKAWYESDRKNFPRHSFHWKLIGKEKREKKIYEIQWSESVLCNWINRKMCTNWIGTILTAWNCYEDRHREKRMKKQIIIFPFHPKPEEIIEPGSKKFPENPSNRGKKSRKRGEPHCQLTAQSKYERATFAEGSVRRSLNLSSTRVPKQSKPQSVHASRQIFSGPSPVNQAVPNPLSLPLSLYFCSVFAWCSNFASRQPVRFLDKGEATVCESCPRNRPQRPREARVHTRKRPAA